MISVLIASESRYIIERRNIRQMVEEVLKKAGLVDVEVSVLVVGSRKIKALNSQYRQLDEPTDVLSFPQESSRGPDGVLRLGDVVVCYPICREEAALENKLVSEKMNELVEHGLKHLLGEHHD